jgi:hypothetical protein
MSERHKSLVLQLSARPIATDDYEIFEGKQRIGCVYKVTFPTSEQWCWHLYAEGGRLARKGRETAMPLAGLALRKALAACRRTMELARRSRESKSRTQISNGSWARAGAASKLSLR